MKETCLRCGSNPSRIYIEKINGPFLFGDVGRPREYSAGLELAIS
jgi:hypothetical protein